MTDADRKAELDAQIADAESKGDLALAGRLKAEQLVEYRDRPREAPDERKIRELREAADRAETMGNYGESARLRARWLEMLR